MATPRDFLTPMVLSFFLVFSALPAVKPDLQSDRVALQAFRAAVGRYVRSWNDSVTPCEWRGISCDPAGRRVTDLRLPGSRLVGVIPDGILGNLTGLRTISFRFNALSGPLPSDLFALKELRSLNLQDNRFSGKIPASISSLQKLVRLNLAGNNFSGLIPDGIVELGRLRTLYLERNRLSGRIPDVTVALDQFNVSYNGGINGSIPPSLRSQPPSAFFGLQVCGLPSNPCPSELAPAPASAPAGNGGNGAGGKKKKKKLSGGAIAGIVVGCAVGVLALVLLLCVCCGRKTGTEKRSVETGATKGPDVEVTTTEKRLGEGGNGAAAGAYTAGATSTAAAAASVAPVKTKGDSGSGQSKKLVFCVAGPKSFDLEDLLRASAEVLGKGTFGTAYKAILEMGIVVAVKRLRDVNLPEEEFKKKIEAVGALEHPNLVPLWAYYFSKDEKLLVYDYIPMGSLSALLHGSRGSGRSPLHWNTRVSIALASARGIQYIHSAGAGVSHGNIKSSNILLDGSQNARVSDHGLAPLAGPSTLPNRLAGYRAPEVIDARRVSQKADVYSFGVLLLELLTGKAPAQALLNDEGVDLPRWVQSVVREEWTAEVFDPELLRYQSAEEEMVQLLQLAIDCTAQYPDKRPAMAEVVARLEDIQRSSAEAQDRALPPADSAAADDQHSPRQSHPDDSAPPPIPE